jgi:excisionase family DNA binding protein
MKVPTGRATSRTPHGAQESESPTSAPPTPVPDPNELRLNQTRAGAADGRLLTIREVAARLCVSERTDRNLANARALRGMRIDRVRRFDPRDIEAYIERSKRAAGRP